MNERASIGTGNYDYVVIGGDDDTFREIAVIRDWEGEIETDCEYAFGNPDLRYVGMIQINDERIHFFELD